MRRARWRFRATGEAAEQAAARALIDAAGAHFEPDDWERFWRFSPLGRFYRTAC